MTSRQSLYGLTTKFLYIDSKTWWYNSKVSALAQRLNDDAMGKNYKWQDNRKSYNVDKKINSKRYPL